MSQNNIAIKDVKAKAENVNNASSDNADNITEEMKNIVLCGNIATAETVIEELSECVRGASSANAEKVINKMTELVLNQSALNNNSERGSNRIEGNIGATFIQSGPGSTINIGNISAVSNNQGRGNNGDVPNQSALNNNSERGSNRIENTQLTPQISDKICLKIGKDWRRFGAWLDLSNDVLDHINHDCTSLYEKAMGVLKSWEQNIGTPSWEQLKDILNHNKRKDIVREIEKYLQG